MTVWRELPKRGLWDTVHHRVGDPDPVYNIVCIFDFISYHWDLYVPSFIKCFNHKYLSIPTKFLAGMIVSTLEGVTEERFVGHSTPQVGEERFMGYTTPQGMGF